MARPRRGKRRLNRRDWLSDYLVTGIEPDRDDPEINPFEVLDVCRYESPVLRAAWEGSGIMRHWNQPGLRPFAWWLFDAPRLPLGTFPGRYYDGTLPEPRRHLGGPGQPIHEVFCYMPSQHFGIWNWFGGPENPPTFESQFGYLTRHALLLPGEDDPLAEPHPHPAEIENSARWEALKSNRRIENA